MSKKYRIVFMGTPDFSVPALEALNREGHEVVLVVTQPDRPKGRGQVMVPPPVKTAALKFGNPVVQPESVKGETFREMLEELAPDYFVVVAYGHILSKALLAVPKRGAINIHASLLPRYRGAAPIQWSIIRGERETGVTTMLMDPGMDTGDMLLKESLEIRPDDTAGTLHDRLMALGGELIVKTLDGLAEGSVTPTPQDHDKATYSPMLKKAHGKLDWQKSARELDNFIRGMSPWPGAFTFLAKKRLKIYKARAVEGEAGAAPGTVIEGFTDEIRVATGDGALSILEIQGASGKRMPTGEFLRGFRVAPGQLME